MNQLEHSGLYKILKEIYNMESLNKKPSIEEIQRVVSVSDRDDFIKALRLLEKMNLIKVNWRGRIHLTNKGREIVLALNESHNSRFFFNFADKNSALIEGVEDIKFNEEQFQRLMDVDPPANVEIIKILPGNPTIERQLLCIGIIPGVKAEVMAKSKFGGTVILKIGGFEVALSRNITHRILVRRL